MKKLYLTSFVFKTGDQEYKDYRLVLVTKDNVDRWKELHRDDEKKLDDAELLIAYKKFFNWFSRSFPESKLIYYITHPVVDDDFLINDVVSYQAITDPENQPNQYGI